MVTENVAPDKVPAASSSAEDKHKYTFWCDLAEDGQDRTLGNINILKRIQTRITQFKGSQGYSK